MLEVIEVPVNEAIATARTGEGRHTRALLKTAEARVMLVGMPAGSEWPQHKAAGRVIVRVERGRIEFSTDNETRELEAGGLATVQPGESHTVRAVEDAAVLVIVAGPSTAER